MLGASIKGRLEERSANKLFFGGSYWLRANYNNTQSHHVICVLCYLTDKIAACVFLNRYCAQFELTETRPSCLRSPLVQWSKQLVKGATLCVECQALVMKDPQLGGGRCRGHGILNRETRWSAVAVPGCHGKWVMKSPHAECQCSPDEQLSFVLVWHYVPRLTKFFLLYCIPHWIVDSLSSML